jgi:hypothetical protein
MGIDVLKMQFDYSFVNSLCIDYTTLAHFRLSACSAITFHWKLSSDSLCPTESPFVTSFVKGL